MAHLLELILGYVGAFGLVVFLAEEYVVPGCSGEMFRFDAEWASLGTIQYTTLQQMSHCVVCHVNS